MYESQIKDLKKLWLPNWNKDLGRARITAGNTYLSYIFYSINDTNLSIWRSSLELYNWNKWDDNVSVKLVR